MLAAGNDEGRPLNLNTVDSTFGVGARGPGHSYSYYYISKKIRMQWCTFVPITAGVF